MIDTLLYDYLTAEITPLIVQAEAEADEAFKAQADCQHIWEKVEREVWQCEACGDLVGPWDGDDDAPPAHWSDC